MPGWLLQNLVSNIVYGLLVLAVGASLAWLRLKRPLWTPYAVYALGGTTCAAALIFFATGRPVFTFAPSITTSENIEERIKAWAEQFNLGIQKTAEPDAFFADNIALHNGTQVLITRTHDRPLYLQMRATLGISPEHLAIVSKLSAEERNRASDLIMLELTRARIGYVVSANPFPPPFQGLIITKSVPIQGITDSSFISYLDEMDSQMGLARFAVRSVLDTFVPKPKA
jgi:hypothetical protein